MSPATTDTVLCSAVSVFLSSCAMMMSHYARHNITKEAAAVTTYGFHALCFVAEAAVFTFMGGDFVLSDFGGQIGDGGA
jgi:hypothetical protein